MNIVQLQYKLRDLPESAVKAAANGQIPDIPEMLATMELNRRARLENAGAKTPTKSIKEQLEEKLSAPKEQMGLPGVLGQAQQANGEPQQDQVQQAGQQAPDMAGVAGLPTSGMFKQFNTGGIVAFADGDLVEGENQSAAEVARLKQAEKLAQAQELMAALGVGQAEQPVARQAPAPALPADAQRAKDILMQAPGVSQFNQATERLLSGVEKSTPEQEYMDYKNLLEKFNIRPPKEADKARAEADKAAYAKDVERREALQGAKLLAEAARPNVHGRYMPGTIGGSASTFGLANLEADRAYREAKDKEISAAVEEQNAMERGNLKDALAAAKKKKEAELEINKAVVTASGQFAGQGISGMERLMSNEENKRYHDMWAGIQNQDLKLKAAQIAAQNNQSIPEVMRYLESLEKKFPDRMKNLNPEQKLEAAMTLAGKNVKGDIAYEAQTTARSKLVLELAGKDRGVLAAKEALAKAQKNKSPIEEEEALAKLKRAMDAVEMQVPPITRLNEGLGGLFGGAPSGTPKPVTNTSSSGSTIKYDSKGNRIP